MPRKNNKIGYTFIPAPRDILESEQYAKLSSYAVKLLFDLFAQHRGKKNGETNNGDFCASWSFMEKRGWRSRATLTKSIKELLNKGFIQKTRQGGRNSCNLFGVTWLAIDYCKGKLDTAPTRLASNLWKNNSLTQLTTNPSTTAVPIKDSRHDS